ncbi:MAG: hypothetical protein IT317_22275 [Anaerolineales bacterium]|nr:hypothetical protein [Anaerolineales bacterium]
MTAKQTTRPAAKPAKPQVKTYEQRAPNMPRLQSAARPAVEPAAEAEAESPLPETRLSDKDVILRLVEVLKGL